MALLQVWLPALVVGHLVALVLLVYGAGFGVRSVTRCWKVKHKGDGLPRTTSCPDPSEAGCDQAENRDANILLTTQDCKEVISREATGGCRPARLNWIDVGCTLQLGGESKTVLSKAYGSALPGELVGLLGPSGAGKSTLLDILAGRKSVGKQAGCVTCNEVPLGSASKQMGAYVPQESVFLPTLTAAETVAFAAQLSLPQRVSKAERTLQCHRILTSMGLQGSQHTQVGGNLPGGLTIRGLSGGEQRRLRIACALVSQPSIVFLDEPTSGLDSHAALSVMKHLARLAAEGHTCLATIHQPRAAIWEFLNKVAILSEGRCVYFGKPGDIVPWFSGQLGHPYNPAAGSISDWVVDLVSVRFQRAATSSAASLDNLETHMESGCMMRALSTSADVHATADLFNTMQADAWEPIALMAKQHAAPQTAAKYAVGWPRQFKVNLQRCFLAQIRNPTDACMRLLISTWVGLFAGLVFFDDGSRDAQRITDALNLLFFLQLLFTLLPFCFLSFLSEDRKFYAADAANGLYSPSAYYVAMLAAQAPPIMFNTVVGALVAYGLGNLNPSAAAVALSCLMMALVALCAIQLLTMCTLWAPNQDLAFAAAVAIISCDLLLGGFFIRVKSMHFDWVRAIAWLSFTRYSVVGQFRTELAGQYTGGSCITAGVPAGQGGLCLPTGDQVLVARGYLINVPVAYGAMVGFCCVWMGLGFLGLLRLREQR